MKTQFWLTDCVRYPVQSDHWLSFVKIRFEKENGGKQIAMMKHELLRSYGMRYISLEFEMMNIFVLEYCIQDDLRFFIAQSMHFQNDIHTLFRSFEAVVEPIPFVMISANASFHRRRTIPSILVRAEWWIHFCTLPFVLKKVKINYENNCWNKDWKWSYMVLAWDSKCKAINRS